MSKRGTDDVMGNAFVEVKPAPGKGRGVFAKCDIKKGTTIEVAPALLIPINDEGFVLTSFLGHYSFAVCVGKETYSLIGMGFSSFYNHDKNYNVIYDTSTTHIVFQAKKDIKKGVELSISYGWDKKHYKEVGIKNP